MWWIQALSRRNEEWEDVIRGGENNISADRGVRNSVGEVKGENRAEEIHGYELKKLQVDIWGKIKIYLIFI